LLLVIGLGALSFDVLLNAVNGRLIRDQALLNLVKAVVNFVLEDHVAAGVVFHGVISRLLSDVGAIGGHLVADQPQALLFSLMSSLELANARELVSHFVFHSVDVLRIDFHLLVHAAFEICDLFEVTASRLNFNLKGSSSALSFVQLALLKVEILAHLFYLVDAGQGLLAIQIFRHVLKQGDDRLLCVGHLSLQCLLLGLVLLSKLIDLLLFRVEHLKLFLAAHATCTSFSSRFVTQLVVNFFDVAGVVVNHLS